MDNLDLGVLANASHTLAMLRASTLTTKAQARTDLAPGAYLSMDPGSDTKGQVISRPGDLLELELTGSCPGQWLSFNIELGQVDLSRVNVLALMCKSQAAHTLTYRVSLRSGIEGGFVDAFFQKRGIAYDQASVHADVLKLSERTDVPTTAPWRELLVFLPPETQQLNLLDIALVGM